MSDFNELIVGLIGEWWEFSGFEINFQKYCNVKIQANLSVELREHNNAILHIMYRYEIYSFCVPNHHMNFTDPLVYLSTQSTAVILKTCCFLESFHEM